MLDKGYSLSVLWQGAHLKVSKWLMHTFRSYGHTFPSVHATCLLDFPSCMDATVIGRS